MLLPEKHIGISESILGLGFLILTELDEPRTLDELWTTCSSDASGSGLHLHSFDNVVLALCFLYAIGAIAPMDDGRIAREVA